MKLYCLIGIFVVGILVFSCSESSQMQSSSSALNEASSNKDNLSTASDNNSSSIDRNLLNDRKNIFTGDLDGDGKEDKLFIVNAPAALKNLSKTTVIVSPWKNYGESSSIKSQLGLVVQLSSKKEKQENYLIADVNSPSVLDTEAAREISIIKLNTIEPDDVKQLKKMAKGDIILIPTEAGIDTYLYWSGMTFTIFEPADSP